MKYVQDYAQSLGAKYVCSKLEKFTTISDDNEPIQEILKMKIFKFGNEYFWLEHHFQPDRPFKNRKGQRYTFLNIKCHLHSFGMSTWRNS